MRSLQLLMVSTCLTAGLAGADVVLYDASSGGGTPGAQNMHYLADGAGASQSESGGVTTLASDQATSAGYFNWLSTTVAGFPVTFAPKVPVVLDRSGDGYTLRFVARLVSESHASADRAGFSVIALASDGLGIELGFWEDEVWAQSGAAFTHAEGAAVDTTATMKLYELAILGSGYTLYADGAELLAGALRDYSAHSNDVYSHTDFVFLGDNTSSAGGTVELGEIRVLDAAVPEPASLGLLSLGAGALLRRRRG
ncbi:MAG: PEP-CTERM sorting domain-containing protein [Planctomycetota bacterium]